MRSIGRIREILSEVSIGLNQAKTALEEAKEEFDLIATRLEHLEAVNSHNIEQKENKALAQMREVENSLHPGG